MSTTTSTNRVLSEATQGPYCNASHSHVLSLFRPEWEHWLVTVFRVRDYGGLAVRQSSPNQPILALHVVQ